MTSTTHFPSSSLHPRHAAARPAAADAQSLGLLTEIYNDDELAGGLRSYLQKLRDRPHKPPFQTKRLLRDAVFPDMRDILAKEAAAFRKCSADEKFRRNVRPFAQSKLNAKERA